jgi:GDP-6-deoxy-D-talose 4-dehydrogenase
VKTLVTGLSGFTGRYLQAELSMHGHEVVALEADLTDADAVLEEVARVQAEWVVHLAAVAFVGHGEPNDFYRVNLLGSRNLLAALAACGKVPDCVLLASSANVYGNAAEGVLDETVPPHPANDYAVSKLAMEHMARLWLEKLPVCMTRPFNYTGVGQSEDFLLPKMAAHFRARAAAMELGNVDIARDFSDVRAVVAAYRRLLEVCPRGETVNVCSGRARSLKESLEMMERITGHRLRVDVNPAYVRANDVRTLCGSNAKLQRLIGPWSTPPLEQTLRWMLESPDASSGQDTFIDR